MKKEDYRPIEYGWSSYSDNQNLKKGLFHSLIKKKEDEGSEYILVLIEDENGSLQEVHKDTIRFID